MLLGMVIFSFTVSNSILILFFGIPLTRKLNKKNLLRSHPNVIVSYLIALCVQLIILTTVTIAFYTAFSDSYFGSLLLGYVLGILGIIRARNQFGFNLNNFNDYLEKNKDSFWEELIDGYRNRTIDLYNIVNEIWQK